MNEFAIAYHEGLQAAANADDAREEIDRLIEELSQSLRETSAGKIASVSIEERTRRIPAANIHPIDPLKPFPGREIPFTAIVAQRALSEAEAVAPSAVLCELRIAPSGFPATLIYAERDVLCRDAAGLRRGLMEMLRHPEVARRLRHLVENPES